ncbi:MAG: UMP kinase [Chloroflexi bacterium]|nr:UMP kinase [Chloroflexota bacterium]MCH8234929.1 UMP kinase [Chloroflexota bacterium]MCH8816248.1 UMP kinase [Chloroflexota bacterium]
MSTLAGSSATSSGSNAQFEPVRAKRNSIREEPVTTYKRVLLKLSGESLKGDREFGLDPDAVDYVAGQVAEAADTGLQIGIVVGGGNIWRGADYEAAGMDRSTADSAGMLATIINSLALQDALERTGHEVRTQTAISMSAVAEPYIRRRAIRHFEKGRLVIFAGGTGSPYMSTDTAAALRALEVNADALWMAKNNIDAIYTSDPNVDNSASKLGHITHLDALQRRVGALDATALSMCMDNGLPIVVFDMFKPGNLLRILRGEEIGTLISDKATASVKKTRTVTR